ncbi:hypothetical protein U9M48_034860 [Paspalum notatum var. saurae]|uniref:Uncharacterized protein n=1 Tax=Paspalum notatum var. saurae TaxID=547442 RepID=A0AAQ3UE55_PASNO
MRRPLHPTATVAVICTLRTWREDSSSLLCLFCYMSRCGSCNRQLLIRRALRSNPLLFGNLLNKFWSSFWYYIYGPVW